MKASETKSEMLRQTQHYGEAKPHEVTASAVAETQYIYAVDARAVDDYHQIPSGPPPPYPGSIPPPAPQYPPPQPDESSVRQYLRHFGWPNGLQSLFLQTRAKVPIRYFICDDSGSMNSSDGKHTIGLYQPILYDTLS